jgi:acetoacetyl-CoA reductase/3-oxoacyl-[acyl-carrier protein] reductase
MSTETGTPERAGVVPTDEAFPAGYRRPRMTGRVVFVTGGTRGIGAAISRSFAEQGAVVAAGYSHDKENADALMRQFEENGMTGSIHQGNVGSAEDCRRTINEVIERHGRLDVLVNNAGITIDKTALKLTDEDWYKVLAVNLSGAFFMSQAVLPHMLERGTGRIINISSIIGSTGNIGQTNYAASKSGMFGLTKSLAREACFQLSGLHRHRDAPGHAREGAGAGQVSDPGRPVRPPG